MSFAARALAEFHEHPNALIEGTNTQALRRTLQQEEHDELMHELEEAAAGRGDLRKIARELADVLYVTYGSAWAFGIDLDAALAEVHRAAMDKMNAGLRRDDGKILKPPGFVPPDMTAAVASAAPSPALFVIAGDTTRSAVFSPCRTWRYSLRRIWDDALPAVQFVGLNPSTADETLDDPTIRRCIGFARDWGYGGLVMTNLFAFRATDPKDMKAAADPVGPQNDTFLEASARGCALTVAAWGVHGTHQGRAADVIARGLLGSYQVLRLSKDGHPWHPLYLPAELRPFDPTIEAAA